MNLSIDCFGPWVILLSDGLGDAMLKVVKKTKSSRPIDLEEKGWVLLRTSKKSEWISLRLPFTVGAHTDNDIFVNAPTMRQISRIGLEKCGEVVFVDAQTMEPSTNADLAALGIEFVGVFDEDPLQMSLVQRHIKRILLKEASFFRSIPLRYKQVLPQRQLVRVGVICGLGVLSFVGLMTQGDGGASVEDLSTRPIAAKLNDVLDLKINSDTANDPYSKGFTLSFEGVDGAPSKEYVLTVVASGLDVANEFSIELGGQHIADTQASIQCADAICSKDFPVAATVMGEGSFKLVFKHQQPSSPFFVKSVFLRGMEPATDEDRERVSQLMVSAERYFDERHLLVQNIRSSLDSINEIESILSSRSGIEPLKARFGVAKSKIVAAFKETSSDYQFRLQKELKLGHSKVAIGLVNEMLKLYPDPTSKQFLMLVEQRKRLQEDQK